MTIAEKEAAKAEFGFSALPFCVVFAADGSVLYRGDPGQVDFATVFDAKPAEPKPAEAELAAGLEKSCAVAAEPAARPLAEANREPAVLGFGNDDEDF